MAADPASGRQVRMGKALGTLTKGTRGLPMLPGS